MKAGVTTPLFLSRLILNPHSRQVMNEMAHPYEMHRTLMRAFPRARDESQCKARGEFGVLFRADVDDVAGVVKVYVQSRIKPDWSFLKGLDYLSADAEVPRCEFKDVMPACRTIQKGQILSFRLRANPTKRIWKVTKGGPELKGKRVGLLHEEDQIDWLMRKGQEREKGRPGGFAILQKKVNDEIGQERHVFRVSVCGEGKQKGRKREAGLGHVTTHLAVLFDGLLEITDTNAFLDTLVSGIGPGKAFGFGLLSVAPVRP